MTFHEARRLLITDLVAIYDEREATNISDWVIEWLTGMKRSDRVLQKDQPLSEDKIAELEAIKKRLLLHEPVQYVLGEAWFSGLKFYVNNSVLIPRPETEELIEWVISNCRFPIEKLDILDIGSGSGCIPIALKRKLRKANVISCDISESALIVARRNAETLGAAIDFRRLDFLDQSSQDQLGQFDIVVSNPPYVAQIEKTLLRPNVLEYEPGTALFVPDNDPALFYKAIAQFGKTHLAKEGLIYVEIPEDKGPLMVSVFENLGYKTELKKDMQGKDRMIKAHL